MGSLLMAVDDYESDRERALCESAEAFDCSIDEVEDMAEPGGFICHEAMTMLIFMYNSFVREICEQPAILANPRYYIQARQIESLLFNLMETVTKDHLDE